MRFTGKHQDRAARLRLLGTSTLVPVALALAAAPALAQAPGAMPTGGRVTAGSATIAQTPSTTRVTQSSDRAVVDWQRFDVGRNHSVAFQQPSASSWTLNRVNTPDPSLIAGRITANGGVAIVNQSGVVFAEGAQVNVGSLIASAANVTNENFMAGRLVFDGAPRPGARVENRGDITVAERGIASLVAPGVANSGTIRARLGRVALAGAETYALDLAGDGLVSVDVTRAVARAPDGATALVTNSGLVEAAGGSVLLTADAAQGLVEQVVRNTGRVSASNPGGQAGQVAMRGRGGEVRVEGVVEATGARGGRIGIEAAGGTATVAAGARVDASGTARGGEVRLGGATTQRAVAAGEIAARGTGTGAAVRGGLVAAQAKGEVVVAGGAKLDASGAGGGGTVLAGTTGIGRSQQMAARTTVERGATLAADATEAGTGGTVVVNSTERTEVRGRLSARGGPQGGDGGFVELSGQGELLFTRLSQQADVAAPAGRPGEVLIDPVNIVVRAGGAVASDETDDSLPNVGTDRSYSTDGTPGTVVIAPSDFENLAGVTYTLSAHQNITIEAAINAPLTALNLHADGAITQTSGGTITVDTLTIRGTNGGATPAGSVNLTSANRVGTLNAIVTAGLNFTNDAPLTVSGITAGTSATVTTTGGSGSLLTVSGNVSAGGGIVFTSSGGITQSTGTLSGAGVVELFANGGPLSLAGTVESTGAGVNLSGTAITQSAGTIEAAATVTLTAGSGGIDQASGATIEGVQAVWLTSNGGSVATSGSVTSTTADVRLSGTGITQDGTIAAATTATLLATDGGINHTAGTIQGVNGVALTASGLGSVTVSGGVVDSSAGAVQITGVGVTQGGGTIDAGTSVSVNAGTGGISQAAGTITGSQNVFLFATGGTVATAGTVTSTSAAVQLNGTGVTQSGGAISAGTTVTLAATTGGVTQTAGSIQGPQAVALAATGGTVSVAGTVESSAGVVQINGTGITQTAGSIEAGTAVTFSATTGGISQTAGSITGEAEVFLVATGGPVATAGSVTSNTAFVQLSGTSVTQSGGAISAGTTVTLNAGTGGISQGPGSITGVQDVWLVATNGAVATSGTVTSTAAAVLISGTGITQSGGLIEAASTATLTAGTGGIAQTAGTIQGGGSVSLTATGGNVGTAGTVTSTAAAVSIAGTAITQTAGLIDAATTVTLAAGAGGISQAAGTIQGGGDVTLTATGGSVGTAGTVTSTAANVSISGIAITQSAGTIGAFGTATLTATTGGITQAAGTIQGGGSVSLTATGGDIEIAGTVMSTNGAALLDTNQRLEITGSGLVDAPFVRLRAPEAQIDGRVQGTNLMVLADTLSAGGLGDLLALSGTLVLAPRQDGRGVTLGGSAAGTLSLDADLLGRVRAETLVVGRAGAGSVTLAGDVNLRQAAPDSPGAAGLRIDSGAAVLQTGGRIDVERLNVQAGGVVDLRGPNLVNRIGLLSTLDPTATSAVVLAAPRGMTAGGNLAVSTAPSIAELAVEAPMRAGANARLTLRTDDVALSAALETAGGTIELLPVGERDITLGGSVAGTFSLTSGEIELIGSESATAARVRFGRSLAGAGDGTGGAIQTGASINLIGDVRFRGGSNGQDVRVQTAEFFAGGLGVATGAGVDQSGGVLDVGGIAGEAQRRVSLDLAGNRVDRLAARADNGAVSFHAGARGTGEDIGATGGFALRTASRSGTFAVEASTLTSGGAGSDLAIRETAGAAAVQGGGTWVLAELGTVTLEAATNLTNAGVIASAAFAGGTVQGGSGSALENTGLIALGTTTSTVSGGTLTNSGTIVAGSVTATTTTNSGRIGTEAVTGALTNQAGGRIATGAVDALAAGAQIGNAGVIEAGGGATTLGLGIAEARERALSGTAYAMGATGSATSPIVASGRALTVTADGDVSNTGIIRALTGVAATQGLTVAALAGDVSNTGDGTTTGVMTSVGALAVTATAGQVSTSGTVQSTGAAVTMEGAGVSQSGGSVQGGTTVTLTAGNGGISQAAGSITGADAVALTATGSGSVSTAGTVQSTGAAVTMEGAGVSQSGGSVQGGTTVTLTAGNGGISQAAGSITGAGNVGLTATAGSVSTAGTVQSSTAGVTVAGQTGLTQSGGSITGAQAVSLSSSAGAVSTAGTVESTAAGVTISGTNGITQATTGAINANGPVVLTATNGNIAAGGEIRGTTLSLEARNGAELDNVITNEIVRTRADFNATVIRVRNAVVGDWVTLTGTHEALTPGGAPADFALEVRRDPPSPGQPVVPLNLRVRDATVSGRNVTISSTDTLDVDGTYIRPGTSSPATTTITATEALRLRGDHQLLVIGTAGSGTSGGAPAPAPSVRLQGAQVVLTAPGNPAAVGSDPGMWIGTLDVPADLTGLTQAGRAPRVSIRATDAVLFASPAQISTVDVVVGAAETTRPPFVIYDTRRGTNALREIPHAMTSATRDVVGQAPQQQRWQVQASDTGRPGSNHLLFGVNDAPTAGGTASGEATLNPAGPVQTLLTAGQSPVFFLIDGGTASGVIASAGRIGVHGLPGTERVDGDRAVNLYGTLNNVTDGFASQFGRITARGAIDQTRYRFNNCVIGAVNCFVTPQLTIPVVPPATTFNLQVERPRFDADALLLNVGERDF